MKNRKLLSLIIVFAMVIALSTAIPVAQENNDSINVTLSSPARTWQGHDFEIRLTNNEAFPITVSLTEGEDVSWINSQYDGQKAFWVNLGEGWHPLDPVNSGDEIFGVSGETYTGNETLEIAPGETKVITRISTGQPGTWRGFYFGNRTANVVFSITDDDENIHIFNGSTSTSVIYENVVSDKVNLGYSAGDTLEMSFSNFPGYFDENGPNRDAEVYGNFFTTARVYFMISTDKAPPTIDAPVFEGTTEENGRYYIDYQVEQGAFDITGKINQNIPAGYIGYEIHLSPAPEGYENLIVGPRPIILDTYGEYIPYVIAKLPATQNFRIYPELKDLGDLLNTQQNISFINQGFGSITFDSGLNIYDSLPMFANIDEHIKIGFDAESGQFFATVDTNLLEFLKNKTATIYFVDASINLELDYIDPDNIMEYIDLTIIDQGEPVADISDYIDLSLIEYDEQNDILILPVKHFTSYLISRSSNLPLAEEETTTAETTVTQTTTTAVETTDSSETASASELPQTGESVNLWVYIVLAAAAVLVIIRFVLYKKSKNKIDVNEIEDISK